MVSHSTVAWTILSVSPCVRKPMLDLLKPWTSLPERAPQVELLDMGEGTAEEVRQNLDDMARVNRWLGGHAALRRFLLPRLRVAAQRPSPLRILDIACGSASMPVMLAEWARRRRIRLQILALDASSRHLRFARERVKDFPEISVVSADARELPLRRGAFDFIISSLFLHHLEPADLITMLRGLQTVCSGTIILNDLVRSGASHFLFQHGARFFYNNRLTLHDGLVSIGQAYTPSEIRGIVRATGLEHAKVYNHGLYRRMTLVIDQNGEETS
jgi:SAM-dependent methyltransferase